MRTAESVPPGVTIAVPVYNRTQGLQRALESAAGQVDPGVQVEILVIDDASTTDVAGFTSAVATTLPRPVRYLRNERNLGLCGNWNRCLEVARGSIVNILHSDEVLDPTAAARAMEWFRREPSLAMACSGKGKSGRLLSPGPEAVAEVMLGVQPVSSVFLRMTILSGSRTYDPAFPYFPDLELYPRLASRHPVVFLDDPPLASAAGHSRHHMFSTWEKADFLDAFTAVRCGGHLLSGISAADAESRAISDAAGACQHILWKSWRGGKRSLARRYYRLAIEQFGLVPNRSERWLNAASRVPGGLPVAMGALGLKWRLQAALGSASGSQTTRSGR